MREVRIPIKGLDTYSYKNMIRKLYSEISNKKPNNVIESINKRLGIILLENLEQTTIEVDEIIIKDDYVKVTPERGIAYTLNGFKFLTKGSSGESSFDTLLWIVRGGYSVVNPRKKTVFKTYYGTKAITKLGLSVVGNKDFSEEIIDPKVIFHIASRKLKKLNVKTPVYINLCYDGKNYVNVDVESFGGYSLLVIELRGARMKLHLLDYEDETSKILKSITLPIVDSIEGGKELFEEMVSRIDDTTVSKKSKGIVYI